VGKAWSLTAVAEFQNYRSRRSSTSLHSRKQLPNSTPTRGGAPSPLRSGHAEETREIHEHSKGGESPGSPSTQSQSKVHGLSEFFPESRGKPVQKPHHDDDENGEDRGLREGPTP